MADPETPPSFEDLDARLRVARAREEEDSGRGPERRGRPTGMGLGMRIGVELVTAVLVGAGIGWALDAWLRTAPWLMVLFLLLGGAAGVMNVHRVMRGMDETVGLGQAQRRADKARDQ
ncbi:ATP synthase protein I [Candidatus Terasakiella magnetica]|nr:ATP synthase protein I [Candidatus Terasakiella magnetica]